MKAALLFITVSQQAHGPLADFDTVRRTGTGLALCGGQMINDYCVAPPDCREIVVEYRSDRTEYDPYASDKKMPETDR